MSAIGNLAAPARLDGAVLRLLQRAEQLAERFAPAAAAVLVLLFAVWAWFASRGIRLQFDELLEISAASAPTTRQVLSSLAAGVDFNPPLSHFIIRASTSLFGDSELAARLPAFLGVTVLLICLYVFISQQLSRSYGILAMLTILCLPVRAYAIEARPYGLVLGLSGLALILYRHATQRRYSIFALIGLAGCTFALAASHYYAILVVGVLLLAELVRAWELKQPDWAILLCCGGPPMAVLFLLRNVIGQQRQELTHYFARGNLLSFDHGYDILAMDPLVYCLALTLIICAFGLCRKRVAVSFTTGIRVNPRLNEIALGAGLLLLPVIGAVATQFVTHAYVPRYFLPAAIGFAICLSYGIRLFSCVVPGLVVLLIVSLSLGFGKTILQEISRPAETLPSIGALTAEQTPLLFDTPGTYVQIYHYFPSLRGNLWVIADPAASLRYRHYDTDDRIMLALAEQGRAQAIGLSAAIRRWPSFRLVPRSADYIWALRCLMDAGSQIKVRRAFGSSNFIFDVTVLPGSVAQIDACAQPAP
jgi:hypothetical protein